MAFNQLFIRSRKSIGGVELDAVLTETHSNVVRITKNPVELGADISDNAIIEPKQVSIQAEVTDSPLGVAAIGQIVDFASSLFGTSTTDNITRSNAAYNALILVQNQRAPIDIQTRLVLYENMIITNISTTQDKDSSRIVSMTIKAEEVLITESEIVQLTPAQLEAGSPQQQGTSPVKKGRQEPVTPTDSTDKSVLKAASDWLGLT